MVQGHSQIRNDPLPAVRVLMMWKLKGSESSWEKRVGQRGFCNLPICLALTGSLSNMGDDKRSWGIWQRQECLLTSIVIYCFMYLSFCLHSVVGISWLPESRENTSPCLQLRGESSRSWSRSCSRSSLGHYHRVRHNMGLKSQIQ